MKWAGFFALFLLLASDTILAQSLPLRLITFNIRYATSSLGENEKPWWSLFCFIWSDLCRQPHVIDQLGTTASAAPAGAVCIIGLQEVLSNQLTDIKNGLGSPWTHIGVARDDGKASGEYSPILYRTDAVRLLYSETKWLSPTPDVPSFGWDAGSRRIVTIGVFESISTGTRFIHANTHLDNVSSQARVQGILVALARVKAVQETWDPLGVSLTGDFNSVPGGDAYQSLLNTGYMEEVYSKATADQRIGPYQLTYTGFVPGQVGSRFDFIWLGPASLGLYTVQRYEILNNVVGEMYISDHRAVVGDVTLAS